MKNTIMIMLALHVCLLTGKGQMLPSVSPEDFYTRQIHLDFHTSEHMTGVGEKFDKTEWQDALKGAGVNSINIFAKGHHEWSYYPSRYGKEHPNLDFNLLHFPEKSRYVAHLLYAPPIQRGIARVIEDLVPLYDVEVTLDEDEPVRSAYTVPGHQVLDIAQKASGLSIAVPEFSCHTAIVFEY